MEQLSPDPIVELADDSISESNIGSPLIKNAQSKHFYKLKLENL
jgi:hypothetical protein